MRSAGTGGWLLEKPNFQSWDESDLSSLLWLHGIGTIPLSHCYGFVNSNRLSRFGKNNSDVSISVYSTPLKSRAIRFTLCFFQHLKITEIVSYADFYRSKIVDEMEPKSTEHSLAYFYCNYKEDQRRDPASIARSLVKQLCLRTPGVGSSSSFPEAVLAVYKNRQKKSDLKRALSIDECKDLLIGLSTGFLRTTIIVDALDECDQETRGKLCDLLADVVSSSKRVKVFITSRDEGDMRVKFEDSPNVYIQERDNSTDINCYIETEIEACVKAKRLLRGNASMDLQNEVIDALKQGAHGM